MKRLIVAIGIVVACTMFASAEDVLHQQTQMVGAEQLEQVLSSETRDMVGDFDPTKTVDLSRRVLDIAQDAFKSNAGAIKSAVKTMALVLFIVIVCLVLESATNISDGAIITAAGTLGLMILSSSELYSLIGLGKDTMSEIQTFADVLLPVMVSAATMAGSLTGASAGYTLSVLFSGILIRLVNMIFVPAVYAFLALALTDSFLQEKRLERLRGLIGWSIENGLKAVVYIYTGFLALTGLLTGAADETAIKVTKTAMSGMVPVVGSIISNAASTVLSGAALLKNAAGAFGMLSVLAIFLTPFIKIAISFLLFKFVSAISGVVGSRLSGFLAAVSSAMGYILAMVGSGALMSLVACCFFIKTVNI